MAVINCNYSPLIALAPALGVNRYIYNYLLNILGKENKICIQSSATFPEVTGRLNSAAIVGT
jgi:hypothetical protein